MATETRTVRQTILRLNARAWGIATGMLLALVLFLATNFLVLRGGPDVGTHLQLLSIYLPGYSVSVGGSLIGVAYMFVIGYGLGRIAGTAYNRIAGFR